MFRRALLGFVTATTAASMVLAQATPAPISYVYDTTTNSTSNNTNTNNSTSASTSTNTNVNTSTSTSANTNTNYNVNSGTMTNINQNTSTSTSVNSNSNHNYNNDVSNATVTSTSDNTNRNINSDTSNSTINSTASTNNVNQNNNVNVSDSKSYSESVNRQVIDQNIKSPPPSAIAPSMMSYSQDLCTTGQSGAVQTQIIGLSAGRTVRDQNCERMKLSKTLYDMGMRVAAVSLLCQDTRVFKAMEMAGTPCPFMGLIGEEASAAWEENADARPVKD
jgi:hypothetical protein